MPTRDPIPTGTRIKDNDPRVTYDRILEVVESLTDDLQMIEDALARFGCEEGSALRVAVNRVWKACADLNAAPAPDWMIIDATRYALGRRTYQVSVTCEWLLANWTEVPEDAREIIQRDIEEAFRRRGGTGDPYDRAEWDKVRALWLNANSF